MMPKNKVAGLAVLLVLVAAGPLAADMRFELGFGWTLVGPTLNTTYTNQYAPKLTPPDRYLGSSASQIVRIKAKTTYGMNGFFNLLFTDNVGLQILADYHRPKLGGLNDPYQVALTFQAAEPQTYSRSTDWPDSDGSYHETSFSLNALARFRVADNLSLSFSAGPSVFHMEGRGGYIGYTAIGITEASGQYVLDDETYFLIFDFGPTMTYGMNAGIEAAFEAFRHVILAFDVRWYGAAKKNAPLHIVEDAIITQPIEEIEAAIGLGTLRVDLSYFRAGLAIRFMF